MDKLVTTRWKNVEGRAKFLQRVEERMNAEDIKGQILTESERFAYAVCEELDEQDKCLKKLEERVTFLESRT